MPAWENPSTWRAHLARLRPPQGAKTRARPAGGRAEGRLQPPGLLEPTFRAICLILFPQHSVYFPPPRAQPVSYFLPHPEDRAPQTLANDCDFPGDEIRSKRGSLHEYPEGAECPIRFLAVSYEENTAHPGAPAGEGELCWP